MCHIPSTFGASPPVGAEGDASREDACSGWYRRMNLPRWKTSAQPTRSAAPQPSFAKRRAVREGSACYVQADVVTVAPGPFLK
jgi:hypothetical protein